MIFLNRTVLFVVVLGLLSTVSCSLIRSSKDNPQSPVNANKPNGNGLETFKTPNDNVEELRSYINVPFEPEEVSWRLVNSKQGERLIAVIRLNPSDAATYAQKVSGGSDKLSDVDVEEWFPAELKAMGETHGQSVVSGAPFAPNDLLREPFTSGDAYFIPQSDYLIVEFRKS